MPRSLRSSLLRGGLAAVLALGSVLPAVAQGGTSGASREDYAACLARDDAAFREAIERVTVRSLEASIRGLDYRPVVAEEWRKGGIDAVIARRVDAALEEIRQETSWGELISSLASKETQAKLARAAAERVYHSTDVKRAIEALADGVSREVGTRLELASSDASEQATGCLKAFLGPRYGQSVARAVASDAGQKLSVDAQKGAPSVSSGRMLVEGKEGIAGLVVLVMRRQLGNLATRVSQRVVGAVLGRVVTSVAGGIGLVLIAKDIWELRNGVLPIIANEMKAPATRDKVQEELAAAIATEVQANLREIGKRTSDGVIEIWHEFRSAHAKALDLAERSAEFKRFIDTVSPRNLARLDEAVALQLAVGGEAALLARVADGSLAEAVERWPAEAFEIARDRRSLEAGFKWRALAGDKMLAKVAALEVHRRGNPDELSRASLGRLLGIDERVAVQRLASLKGRVLEPLLELADPELVRLARALGEGELESLSGYMTTLERTAGRRLLAAVAETPTLMQAVAPTRVREAILASRDQAAALAIMLRTEDLFDAGHFVDDVGKVRAGAVSPQLLLVRYPVALSVMAAMGLALLLLIMRAVVGRRPRPVVPGTDTSRAA